MQILKAYMKTTYRKTFKSGEQIANWQSKQLKRHLAFVRRYSPYYQSILQDTDFEDLPLMNKKLMMEHFTTLNTKNIRKEKAMEIALQAEETRNFRAQLEGLTVGLSSGTSGNRGLFLLSAEEQNEWSGTILAKLLPRGLFHHERISFFLRANSNLYESVGSRLIQFEFFDLLDEVERHVERLNVLQPTIIVAPPSMLRILASYKDAGELSVSPIKIIAVAEVLEPLDKQFIERIFDLPLHNVYQATEGFIAHTCAYGTLHINEDMMIVEKEYLDEQAGKFSPIITDFRRTTQPIIRYQLNDILTLKKAPCPCGSAMMAIESVEGRSDDIFYMKSRLPRERVPIFPDYIRRAVITATHMIKEYRVIQWKPELLEVQLKTDEKLNETEELVFNSLRQLFERKKVEQPSIIFSTYQPPSKMQKLKRIESRVR